MQEHYEPLCKSKEDLHSVYMKFTGASYLNGSMVFRNTADFKEVDKEGVKDWLAGFETKRLKEMLTSCMFLLECSFL